MNRVLLAGALTMGMAVVACGAMPSVDARSPIGGAAAAEGKAARDARGDRAQGEARRAELKLGIDNVNETVTKRNDDAEKKLVEALAIAGGDPAAKKASISSMINNLRAAGLTTTVTAAVDFQQGFFVPDPKALSELGKKKKGVDKKVIAAFTDYSNAVSVVSFNSFSANQNALSMHLQTLQVGAAIAGHEKKFSRPTTAEDLALLQGTMVQERRAEQIAAIATGLAAATSAAITSAKDPKGLDDVVTGMKAAMPPKGEATAEDAKTYLEGLDEGLGEARARYDGWLQQSYGASYPRSTMKSLVDQVFKQAEHDLAQTSLADDRKKRADRRAASSGAGSPEASGAPATGGAVADRALALGKGLLPADGSLRKGLDTFDALRKGDNKGAVTSAMAFVPNGPAKSALGLALKFF